MTALPWRFLRDELPPAGWTVEVARPTEGAITRAIWRASDTNAVGEWYPAPHSRADMTGRVLYTYGQLGDAWRYIDEPTDPQPGDPVPDAPPLTITAEGAKLFDVDEVHSGCPIVRETATPILFLPPGYEARRGPAGWRLYAPKRGGKWAPIAASNHSRTWHETAARLTAAAWQHYARSLK